MSSPEDSTSSASGPRIALNSSGDQSRIAFTSASAALSAESKVFCSGASDVCFSCVHPEARNIVAASNIATLTRQYQGKYFMELSSQMDMRIGESAATATSAASASATSA